MDLAQYAMATFVIIGFVNGLNMALNKDWASFVRFLTAIIAAGVFGFLNWFGLPGVEMGLAVGIASSGVYKTAQIL